MYFSRDISRRRLTAAILTTVFAVPILPALADNIVFDTDNGTFTVNGAPATYLGGTPLTTTNQSGGVTSFYFGGNLTFGSTDVVTAIGGNALSIDAGNNVTIAPNATFNVSPRKDRQAAPAAAVEAPAARPWLEGSAVSGASAARNSR